MNQTKKSLSRKDFFKEIVREIFHVTGEMRRNFRDGMRIEKALESFDQYPIAQTYPYELFEEEAKRLGIDSSSVDKTKAIRKILAKHMDLGRG